MVTTLLNALQTENALTENGMTTNTSSLNHCVDFFFTAGASRGVDKNKIRDKFIKAYNEDKLIAIKLLFYLRDIRGGAGERQIFRDLASYMAKNHSESLVKNVNLIPEYGRWDDILSLLGTELEGSALSTIKAGLTNDSTKGLVSKWLPRPTVRNKSKKAKAETIRKYLKMSPKEYRKMLAELSNTVEQAMCSKDWNVIDYNKLPSKAMANYMKAFSKNDKDRFLKYKESLTKGTGKVNAGAVYPYDIVKSLRHGGEEVVSNAQWLALPNYLLGNNEILLPMCDVSGSMDCAAGQNKNVTCMDVCISLGLYISERNVGPFKDAFLTFSSKPEIEILKGTLSERLAQLKRSDWSMSTNLEAAFDMVLKQAVKHNVPASEMPTTIIILSDMEFNSATGHSDNPTANTMIRRMYEEAGYIVPKIVYWNLNARNDNFPVKFDENGTSMVSGFSPSILTSVLSGKSMTPIDMMLDVVNSERYKKISI